MDVEMHHLAGEAIRVVLDVFSRKGLYAGRLFLPAFCF